MIGSLEISSSALVAQRARMDIIAGNIANANVTRQPDGTPIPYRRRIALFGAGRAEDGGPGVHVSAIEEDPSEFRLKYDPGHPDRILAGPLKNYVQLPNVSITMEYIDAIEAARAYEANVAMMEVGKSMLQQSIRLFA
jgi:flagellar basal-body rod protein FlgC